MNKILVVICILILNGCANVAINKSKIEHIKYVKIDESVTYAEKAFNNGPKAALGASVGGLVGALYTQSSDDNRDDMTRIIQDFSKINLVAYDVFSSELSKDPTWGEKLRAQQNEPDARIKLEVTLYGFSHYNFLADGAEPAFGLTATMYDSQGNIIWRKFRGLIEYPDGAPKYTVEEYLTNLEYYREACRIIAEKLIKEHFLPSLS